MAILIAIPPGPPAYLLIVACSQRKRCTAGLLPAIERYDGPTFQVLRKWRRDRGWPGTLTILVLSAEFGLIPITQPLPWYEHRLTRAEAADPRRQATLTRTLHPYLTPTPTEVFLHLGRIYQQALAQTPLAQNAWPGTILRPAGGIGQKLAALRRWLTRITPPGEPARGR